MGAHRVTILTADDLQVIDTLHRSSYAHMKREDLIIAYTRYMGAYRTGHSARFDSEWVKLYRQELKSVQDHLQRTFWSRPRKWSLFKGWHPA